MKNVEMTVEGDIIIKFDGSKLTQQLFQTFITQLSSILDQVEEDGTFEHDIFTVKVRRLNHYENELIVVDKTQEVR